MCQFCVQHGEGEKWYLQARNYGEDLLSDLARRRYIEQFVAGSERYREQLARLEALDRLPVFVRRAVGWYLTRRMQPDHFGQVVPIEDLEKILGLVNTVVRMDCLCRHVLNGSRARYCYGLSLSPGAGPLLALAQGADGSFLAGPDASGLETLTPAAALAAFREHEREGLCHTIWTFKTPFIGAVCNCDRTDCLAMRVSVSHEMALFFRAESVAESDPAACSGCRRCLGVCQFGAVSYSAERRVAVIDPRHCYGCGVCRAVCDAQAIRLRPRREVPAAANRWL